MASYGGVPGIRDDFRCLVCRQKSVFHCEHDTPYRDQYLSIVEEQIIQKPPRSPKRKTPKSNGNASIPMTTESQTDRRKKNSLNQTANPQINVVKPQEPEKKKSCVIL